MRGGSLATGSRRREGRAPSDERPTRKDGDTVLKKLFALMVVVGLLGLTTGCPSKDKGKTKSATGKTERAKTEVVTGNDGKRTETETKEVVKTKLELTPPADTTIAPGKEAEVEVKVKRTNFDEAVSITFSDLPKGVTADQGEIAKGQDSGKFKLKAAADAMEVTGAAAKVTAKGGGAEVDATFKVNVKK